MFHHTVSVLIGAGATQSACSPASHRHAANHQDSCPVNEVQANSLRTVLKVDDQSADLGCFGLSNVSLSLDIMQWCEECKRCYPAIDISVHGLA